MHLYDSSVIDIRDNPSLKIHTCTVHVQYMYITVVSTQLVHHAYNCSPSCVSLVEHILVDMLNESLKCSPSVAPDREPVTTSGRVGKRLGFLDMSLN